MYNNKYFHIFRQNLRQQFLSAVGSNSATAIQDTFNQLEWTPEMVQAFERNVYFSGNQLEFCVKRNISLVSW